MRCYNAAMLAAIFGLWDLINITFILFVLLITLPPRRPPRRQRPPYYYP